MLIPTLKKLLSILAPGLVRISLLVFGLSLAACSGSGESPASGPSPSPEVSQQTGTGAEEEPTSEPSPSAEAFTNPLFRNGADPWLEYFRGNYYLTTTTWTSQLVMRKSPTLAGLAEARPHYVWSDTDPARCCNFWAFEFHRLEGPNGPRWYLMYTAGVEDSLDGQRLHVLESAGEDPLGPYQFKNTLMPNRWNIDGTYLEHNGKLYVIWSEWVGPNQNGWIAEMTNPWTVVDGTQTIISRPTHDWEMGDDLNGNPGRVNEGQAIIKHEGRTFMSFSASSCHGPNYKIGLMELRGENPLDPDAWHKYPQPFMQSANGVFGPGHNGFFQSPDGTEDWLVYHGNDNETQGCGDTRGVRAQPIEWSAEGLPVFGEPRGPDMPVSPPAGEGQPITAEIEGAPYELVNRSTGQCLTVIDGEPVQGNCGEHRWTLDATADGHYRLASTGDGEVLGATDCATSGDSSVNLAPWQKNACQRWKLETTEHGWLRLRNRERGIPLAVADCAPDQGAAALLGETCNQWRLQPVGSLAIVSVQSGRVMDVENCSQASGANVRQWAWGNAPCQQWRFNHVQEGYYHLQPDHNPEACLVVAEQSLKPGASAIQGLCDNESAQWRLEPLADGTFSLRPRHSELALDLSACALADGTDLGQWEWLDNDCQRFQLRATD